MGQGEAADFEEGFPICASGPQGLALQVSSSPVIFVKQKIRGTVFWGPYKRDPTISGRYYIRVPHFRLVVLTDLLLDS